MADTPSKIYRDPNEDYEYTGENGPYWLSRALAREASPSFPAAASCIDVPAAGRYVPCGNDVANSGAMAHPVGDNLITCYDATTIPAGEQRDKILQCGICMSPTKLFHRPYELQRHMLTHQVGQYPCPYPGCKYVGDKAFKRKDKKDEHVRKALAAGKH